MRKMKLKENDQIMGIDLGTTNSAVSVISAGKFPTLISIGAEGKYTLPSCVRWNGGENFDVGIEAYEKRYESNVIYSVKRIMGQTKDIVLRLPTGEERVMSPVEVSSKILEKIKDRVAELYMPITKCVITVPAYFNQRQIEDTVSASELAGLECVHILKEPTSASYIYSNLGYALNGTALIYDLGGGTFDITQIRFLRKDAIPSKLLTSLKRQYGIEIDKLNNVDSNDQYFCRVLGTYGDVNLGGDDIDKYMADSIIERENYDFTDEQREEFYLRCEKFKKLNITGMSCKIGDYDVTLSSEDLDKAVDYVFEKTLNLMDEIDMTDVDTIVLVGGSTKNQRIRDNLAQTFPNVTISSTLDPDATVALGAGSVAKAISNAKNLAYSDVLPLPIGVLVDESRVDVCIARNTSMPYSTTKQYRTMHDNQKVITLHLYQGLSSDPKKCTYLGKLVLENIPEKLAQEVTVDITFILNGQGRLKIFSKIDGVEREESLVIDNIFNVKDKSRRNKKSLEPQDDFEKVFLEDLKDNEECVELFMERRKLLSKKQDVSSLEESIGEYYLKKASV